jgi:hypothetical protein
VGIDEFHWLAVHQQQLGKWQAEAERERLARQLAKPGRPLRARLADGLRSVAAWLDEQPEPCRERVLAGAE